MIEWRPGVSQVPLAGSKGPASKSVEDQPQQLPQDQLSLGQGSALPATVTEVLEKSPAPPPVPSEVTARIAAAPHTHTTVSPPTTLQLDAPTSSASGDFQLSPWTSVGRQTTFFNPLSSIEPEKLGPLGDFLELPPGVDLSERKPAINAWAQEHQAFVNEYKACFEPAVQATHQQEQAAASPPKTDDQIKASLRALEEKWLDQGASATPEMRTMLMEGFKSKGAFADVARVYEKSLSQDPDFAKYEIPREYFIVALNKTKQTLRSIQESQAFLKERQNDLHLTPQNGTNTARYQAFRDSGLNGEILAGLGRAFKDIHTAAQNEIGKRIDGSGLSKLMQDLSGKPPSEWKGKSNLSLGQEAPKSVALSLQEKIPGLLKKDPSGSEALEHLKGLSGLEQLPSAQELGQWAQSCTPEEFAGRLSSLGQPLEQWPASQKKLTELTNQKLRPFVEKFAMGGISAQDAALELANSAALESLKSPILQASLVHGLEGIKDDLTRCGGLDPSLAAVLNSTARCEVGDNLLLASRKAMEVSRDYYMDGFAIDFEYYPGVNAVYNNLFLGDRELAERLAPMVLTSCQREAGRTTKDYWNLATQVELGLIMNNPGSLLESLPRALDNAKAGWELATTADMIEKLSQQRKMEHSDTQLLDFVSSKLRERIEVGFPPKDSKWDSQAFIGGIVDTLRDMPGVAAAEPCPVDAERARVTDLLLEKSTQFNEVFNSKFVGGNVPFGGQISDIPINRTDLRALRHVIAELGLNNSSSYEDFVAKVDAFVESRFGLVDPQSGKRVLEDLHSPEHKVMDEFSKERHNLTEARTSGASKTNLSVEMLMGTGDCRHTAITKQALFDVWKRDHQSGHLQRALEALERGDSVAYENEMTGSREWDKLQMVTFTMTFHTPIDLNRDEQGNPMKYSLRLDSEGRPIKTPDGKPLAVEDHTFNALLRFDDQGLILSKEDGGLTTQDVFYKHFYPLANHALDPSDITRAEGFDLGRVGPATAEGEVLPCRGVVTRFSGNSPKPIAGECGQTTFGGLATAFNSADRLTQSRQETRHLVDMVTGKSAQPRRDTMPSFFNSVDH